MNRPSGPTVMPCPCRGPALGRETALIAFGPCRRLQVFTSLAALFWVLLSAPSGAQTTVDICSRTQAVEDALLLLLPSGTACDSVSSDDLEDIETLDLADSSISSLDGDDFDGLSGLETLDLSGNNLTALPENLFEDTAALTGLDLADNSISGLDGDDFDGLSKLETLDLSGNSLTALPEALFEDTAALTDLDLADNTLAELPENIFENPDDLIVLDLSGNALTELHPDVFDGLDEIETLNLSDNGDSLTELPAGVFDGLTGLTTLNLNNNALAELPTRLFRNQADLETLLVENNALEELPEDIFRNLDELTAARFAGNTGAPFELEFHLVGNGLGKEIWVLLAEGAPEEIKIPIRFTNATVDGSDDTDSTLTMEVGDILTDSVQLKTTSDGAEVTVEFGTLPTLKAPTQSTGSDGEISYEGFSGLVFSKGENLVFTEGICARTMQIQETVLGLLPLSEDGDAKLCHQVSLQDAQSIALLELNGLGITELKERDFLGFTNLATLDLSGNALTALPEDIFSGLDNLETLDLSDNLPPGNQAFTLTAEVFYPLSGLKALSLSNSALASLPEGIFDELRTLTALALNDNALTALPDMAFGDLISLRTLSMTDNALTALPDLTGLVSLRALWLSDNALTALTKDAFEPVSNLQYLYLSDNAIATLDSRAFHGLPHLLSLSLRGNMLETLPAGIFSGMVSLTGIDLTENPLPGGATDFPLTLELRGDLNSFRAHLDEAAPTRLVVPLTVTGGTFQRTNEATATQVVIQPGATSSEEITVTSDDTGTALAVAIGELPGLPEDFRGIELQKASAIFRGGICNRTAAVQTAILGQLTGRTCEAVTAVDLAGIAVDLDLSGQSIAALRSDDFKGLVNLTGLDLSSNALTALPENVFAGMEKLVALDLSGNSASPFNLTIQTRTDLSSLSLYLGTAAPTELQIPLTVTGGVFSSESDATEVNLTIAAGATSSEEITIAEDEDDDTTLSISIGTLPSLPAGFAGVALAKGDTGLGGICNRTSQIQAAILGELAGRTCSTVTAADLGVITTTLELGSLSIESLKPFDFHGLTALTGIALADNLLTADTLPAGLLSELTSLTGIDLSSNQLTELPDKLFDELENIRAIDLTDNQLTELPDSIGGMRNLRALYLAGNPNAPFDIPMQLVVDTAANAVAVLMPFVVHENVEVPLELTGATASGSTSLNLTVEAENNLSAFAIVRPVENEGLVGIRFAEPLPSLPDRAGPVGFTGLRLVAGEAAETPLKRLYDPHVQLHAQILSYQALALASQAGQAIAARVRRLGNRHQPGISVGKDGSKGQVPLNASGHTLTLWWQTADNRLTRTTTDSWRWDGEVRSRMLGIDWYSSDATLAAGLMTQDSVGSYSYRGTTEALDDLYGTYRAPMHSNHLYLGWKPRKKSGRPGLFSLWAAIGEGSGEVKLRGESGLAQDSTTGLDTAHLGFALLPLALPGGLKLRVLGEFTATTTALAASTTLDALQIDADQTRLRLEASSPDLLRGSRQLSLSGELGVRSDNSSAGTSLSDSGLPDGDAIEYGLKLHYAASRIAIEAGFRTLYLNEDDDEDSYRESGSHLSISYMALEGGRGLSLKLMPRQGAVSSGLDRLWRELQLTGLNAESPADAQMEAELRYGLPVLMGGSAILAPYGRFRSNGRSMATGLSLKLAEDFEIELEKSLRQSAGGAFEEEIRLGGELRF